jgi:hypothetical protein
MISAVNKPSMLSVVMLSVVILNVVKADCRYAECRGAEDSNNPVMKFSDQRVTAFFVYLLVGLAILVTIS